MAVSIVPQLNSTFYELAENASGEVVIFFTEHLFLHPTSVSSCSLSEVAPLEHGVERMNLRVANSARSVLQALTDASIPPA